MPQSEQHAYTSLSVVVGRVFWVFMGPLAVMLLLVNIALTADRWLSGVDLAFFAILGLMVGARFYEQHAGAATTIYGDPATPGHFRRYLLLTIPLATALWVAAKLYANLG